MSKIETLVKLSDFRPFHPDALKIPKSDRYGELRIIAEPSSIAYNGELMPQFHPWDITAIDLSDRDPPDDIKIEHKLATFKNKNSSIASVTISTYKGGRVAAQDIISEVLFTANCWLRIFEKDAPRSIVEEVKKRIHSDTFGYTDRQVYRKIFSSYRHPDLDFKFFKIYANPDSIEYEWFESTRPSKVFKDADIVIISLYDHGFIEIDKSSYDSMLESTRMSGGRLQMRFRRLSDGELECRSL